jgi:nucleoid-associated protein YgaU
MTLEKLTIQYEVKQAGSFTGTIRALFNPSDLSFSRNLRWSQTAPAAVASRHRVTFEERELSTLAVNLFFDTYENAPSGGFAGTKLFSSSKPQSVVPYLDALARLAAIDQELHRPPVCKLRWGKQDLFTGVLTYTKQNLVLFLEDGTPVRATVDCTFLECEEGGDVDSELHSPDVAKKYTLQQGDTLSMIAYRQYNDASLWRRIAEANGIDDPRRLSPGRVILIPKVS